MIEQIYIDGIVPRGNITKLNEECAKMITEEGYVFIITGDYTEYIKRDQKGTYKVEWYDEEGTLIKTEERTAKLWSEVSIKNTDKVLEHYVFDPESTKNVLTGIVDYGNIITLKLYFIEEPKEATYKVQWYINNETKINEEIRKAMTRQKVQVEEKDKILDWYTFDSENVNNIVEAEVKKDGTTTLKLYFRENEGIYVTFNGTTLSFFGTEAAARENVGSTGKYYGNVNKNAFIRSGDEVVGTLDNIPWKDELDSIQTVNIVDPIRPVSMDYYFADLKNCGAINGLDKINTEDATGMKGLFQWCGVNNANLTTIDISTFNTSKVTNMAHMFDRCRKVQTIILPTNLDTRNVTTMRNMFNNLLLVKSIDLSKFDTRNVTDMYGMFYYGSALTSITFPSTFDTSKVTNMGCMFDNCKALTELDVTTFNTSNVADMHQMFANCTKLTSLNLSSFNTEKVMNFNSMFYGCRNLKSITRNFKIQSGANTTGMFTNCPAS